jgi:hypothetical protein
VLDPAPATDPPADRAVGRGTVAARYVAWLERRGRASLVGAALLVAASIYLAAFHLPLNADLSDLLPSDVPTIRDLRRLEARLTAKDTMVAIVRAEDPAVRAAVAGELVHGLGAVDPALVARLEVDDAELRAFVRTHAALYVPLAELEATERVVAARIAANIIAATVVAFGVAALTIGHLNAATAFLGAITTTRASRCARPAAPCWCAR